MENTSKEEIVTLNLSRESWGPRFWKILHTLAECSGGQINTILSNDEADAWIVLLKAQQFVMPCRLCQQHYKSWQLKHRFDKLRIILGEDRRNWLREWVWGCHTDVNESNQKSSPSLNELSELYPKRKIDKEMKELATMFQLGLNKQQLKPEDVARWKLVMGRLRIMYGI